MLFGDHLVFLRGGGDLGTGAAYALHQAGFPVVVLELSRPMAIRRTVSLASVVREGEVAIQGMLGVRVDSVETALNTAPSGVVPVVTLESLPDVDPSADVVVDARVAKRNIDTKIDDASMVVALGPGFTAGTDCHAVIETMRGHRLGRVIWEGSADPDTGVPGELGGASTERLVRSPLAGRVTWLVDIGDRVTAWEQIGSVGPVPVHSKLDGVVRGLIEEGFDATRGLKIADIDPRGDRDACFEISDKARLVGAGVLEAVLVWRGRLEE